MINKYFVNNPHSLSVDNIAQSLEVDPQKGLSEQEAKKRLDNVGLNTFYQGKAESWFKILLSQFNNFLIYILFIGCLFSIATGGITDAIIIIMIVIGIGIIGFLQEEKAQKDIEALRKLAAPRCQVLREGQTKQIDSSQVVPGDILVLQTGDIVAADVRLYQINKLAVNESCLTGESEPVEKNLALLTSTLAVADRKNLVFMGTTIEYGNGQGIVVATGNQTEFGKIAQKLTEIKQPKTPLQLQVNKIGKQLGIIFLSLCFLIFLLNWHFRKQPLIGSILDSVALAVAAVPEGLPAVITICLTTGMIRMKQCNALAKKLQAVETLGCTDVICTDKTGTITRGEMETVEIFTQNNFFPTNSLNTQNLDKNIEKFLTMIATWNEAMSNQFNPTQKALAILTTKLNLKGVEKVDSNPFDPTRKMSSSIHKIDGKYFAVVAGAPEKIIANCNFIDQEETAQEINDDFRKDLEQKQRQMTAKGLHVLAFAVNNNLQTLPETANQTESNLTFLGFVGLKDPVRPEAVAAIKDIKVANIIPMMITGDHPDTAFIIAKEAGIIEPEQNPDESMVNSLDLKDLSVEQLAENFKNKRIFARVSPEDKLKIVETLQGLNHTVAMTGDGVNDAPAIKKANIGIAMGIRGTEVTKETAGIVLLDDNYQTIVNAIRQGRIIFKNIKIFIAHVLSTNVAEVLIFTGAILLVGPVPFSARLLLWLNVVTDFLPSLAIAYEGEEPGSLTQKPHPTGTSIFDKYMLTHIIIQTTICTLIVLGLYLYLIKNYPLMLTTAIFTILSLSETFKTLTSRSNKFLVFEIGIFKNKLSIYALLTSFLLTLATVYVPIMRGIFDTTLLPLSFLLILIILAAMMPLTEEITKIGLRILKVKQY